MPKPFYLSMEIRLAGEQHFTRRRVIVLGCDITKHNAQLAIEELEGAGEIEPDVYVPVLTDAVGGEMDWLPDYMTAPYAYGVRVHGGES